MKDLVGDKNKNVQYDEHMRNLIIGVGALTLDIFIFIFILFNNEVYTKIKETGKSGMIIYIIVVAAFVVLFVFGIFFVRKFIDIKFLENEKVKKVIFFVMTFGILLILLIAYMKEVEFFGTDSQNYVWHKIPNIISISMMFLISVIFLKYIKNKEHNIINNSVFLIYFVISFITGYSLYMPNYFNADLYHGHAYCNSIYNIMNNVTYSDVFTSIYGHYAIIYRLPLEIMGCTMENVVLLISIIGGISMYFACLTVHNIIHNNSIRIITCISLALPVVGLLTTDYWQVQPHRIIFPSIYMYLTSVFIKSKMTKKKILISYLVSVIAIIWNTETGVICTVAWAGLMVFDCICANKTKIFNIVKTIFLHGIATIGSFLLAYGVVNVYNILLGGEVNSIKTFLFPLFTLTSEIATDLPIILSSYMLEMVLYAVMIGWVLYKYVFSKVEFAENELFDARLSVLLTIIGMGQMTYFMNRSAYYNLYISHFSSILLLLIIIKRGLMCFKKIKFSSVKNLHCYEIMKGTMAGVILSVLAIWATGTIVGGAIRTNTRIDSGFQNYRLISDFAHTIKEVVPEDTYAFGIGVPELYSILGWDTQCYVIDFADMNEWTTEYIVSQVDNESRIFTTKGIYESFELSEFSIVNTFEYNGNIFVYCVK